MRRSLFLVFFVSLLFGSVAFGRSVETNPSVSVWLEYIIHPSLPVPAINVPVLSFSVSPSMANIDIKKWRLELHSLGQDISLNDPRIGAGTNSWLQNIKIVASDGTFSTDSKDILTFTNIGQQSGVYTEFTDILNMIDGTTKTFKVFVDTKDGLYNYPGCQFYFVLGSDGGNGQYCFSPTSIKNTMNNQYITDINPPHHLSYGVGLPIYYSMPQPVTEFLAGPGSFTNSIKLHWAWSDESITWFELRYCAGEMDTNNIHLYPTLPSPIFLTGSNQITKEYALPSPGMYTFAIKTIRDDGSYSSWKYASGVVNSFSTTLYFGNPEPIDTFYVLPNEFFYNQFGVMATEPMFAIDARLIMFGGVDIFSDLEFGHQSSDSLRRWIVTGPPYDCHIKFLPNSSLGALDIAWLGEFSGNLHLPVDSMIYYNIGGEAGNVVGQYSNFTRTKYLIGINGIRGDVNRDGLVNVSDVDTLLKYDYPYQSLLNYWDVKYTKTGTNLGLGEVLFSYPDMVSTALINIYAHNPGDPAVQGLGIGQLFTANRSVQAVPVTYHVTNGQLTVNTTGNIISVVGVLNGQLWQKSFTSLSNIQLPNGLVVKNVDAVKVQQSTLTAIEEKASEKPSSFQLEQNYPNPFNPTTTIAYTVASACNVTLRVYDILGKEVLTLVNEEKATGSYRIDFDGRGLASGVYYYKLQAGNYSSIKKMMLIK